MVVVGILRGYQMFLRQFQPFRNFVSVELSFGSKKQTPRLYKQSGDPITNIVTRGGGSFGSHKDTF